MLTTKLWLASAEQYNFATAKQDGLFAVYQHRIKKPRDYSRGRLQRYGFGLLPNHCCFHTPCLDEIRRIQKSRHHVGRDR